MDYLKYPHITDMNVEYNKMRVTDPERTPEEEAEFEIRLKKYIEEEEAKWEATQENYFKEIKRKEKQEMERILNGYSFLFSYAKNQEQFCEFLLDLTQKSAENDLYRNVFKILKKLGKTKNRFEEEKL